MKTFVECSWIIIWVPTKRREHHKEQKSGTSVVVKNERFVETSEKPTISGLIKQFDTNGYDNHGFDLSENFRRREMKSNSKNDFEVVLYNLLGTFQVNPRTTKTNDGHYTQFSIFLENYKVERLILLLQANGIGSTENTSVSVIPASVHLEVPTEEKIRGSNDKRQEGLDDKIKKFYSTIKSRVTVAEVVKRIRFSTLFTFDYVAYLFLASFIALLGLLEDSSVIIVASMLVSPIMGPILASIFGCVVADKELRNKGIRNGLISLFLCVLIGFVFGCLFIVMEGLFNTKKDKFLTKEMVQRGSVDDMILDLFIAFASGAAAALSVLGENTASMVGVAISASLLPPAVNAGLLWAAAAVGCVAPKDCAESNHELLTRGTKQ